MKQSNKNILECFKFVQDNQINRGFRDLWASEALVFTHNFDLEKPEINIMNHLIWFNKVLKINFFMMKGAKSEMD